MSSDTGRAIIVESVSKSYQLGQTHTRLTERLASMGSRLLRRDVSKPPSEDFWALRDVDLEVAPGEAVAIVGRNGAGKSTLLKLLSRITLPTKGRITLDGRVAAMLEVGTGFHPELTGRENVFLNGAILGMRRAEIARKFDTIVEFAGVEQFLDTPVKRYSSGMVVRLAFAVAAHLEPEILVVDEVLAVGDAEFQRRCLGKMGEVTGEGRTILFVSHNQSAVRRLCARAYLLDRGRVVAEGPTSDVLSTYQGMAGASQEGGVAVVGPDVARVATTGQVRITRVALLDRETGQPTSRLRIGQPVSVCVSIESDIPVDDTTFEIGLSSAEAGRFATVQNVDGGHTGDPISPGFLEVTADIDVTLLPGQYVLDVGVHRLGVLTLDQVDSVLGFEVVNLGMDPDDTWPWAIVRGAVRPATRWRINQPASG